MINLGKFFKQGAVESDPRFKILNVEIFIGRMDLAIGESETKHEGLYAEDFFEVLDDGDRASFADEHGRFTKGFLEGGLSCATIF